MTEKNIFKHYYEGLKTITTEAIQDLLELHSEVSQAIKEDNQARYRNSLLGRQIVFMDDIELDDEENL